MDDAYTNGAHSHSGDETVIQGRVVSEKTAPPPLDTREVHLCHHGCDCWQRNFDRYLAVTPEREPDQLDSVEMHALLTAKGRAVRHLHRHLDPMALGRRRLIKTHGEATVALGELRAFADEGALTRAVRERERLDDVMADRKVRPPMWLRVVAWPAIVAAGAFDTWYFQGVFQRLVGNRAVSLLEQVITLLPGVVLTLGMVIAGTTLGKAVYQARRAHEERRESRGGAARLFANLGLWVLRLVLPALLLVVATLWALFRVVDVNAGGRLPLPADFVAVLVVTLSLCAIAVKVAAHDPYVTRESEVRRRLARARRSERTLVRRAGGRLRLHVTAWSDLRAMRDDLVAGVIERYGEAYRFITYARGFHGKAGELPPVFVPGSRRADRGSGGTEGEPPLPEWIGDELSGVAGPVPEYGALREVQEVLRRYEPGELEREFAEVRGRLTAQWSGTPAGRTASADRTDSTGRMGEGEREG
ncbi:hypothetical protein [Streptosporangium sp. NPDC020145]|uniref:hypothetical protein n=1 Tax=Streptosporangium sp. NPDC020145 TaxID=3154694 RepID=UPI0034468FE0